ncbi:hypothetical protein [Prochlorococcus sp. MIT 1307]|uniref:hypothetical protein n=1 Tax=Prochlorococcus sp. MIT 1307 TaxID=3096219 RepID=UPI002A750E15|nr:hypothetical protein [Prochlorococcus sp. MIT 1307]
MATLLAKSRSNNQSRQRASRKRNIKPVFSKKERIDAATLASNIQLQEQHRDLVYSFIALIMKLGLLFIGTTSLIKLGIASHQRMGRYTELNSVLNVESVKLVEHQNRFDRFFTIGGDQRIMDENHQWIAPDRIRVIWR